MILIPEQRARGPECRYLVLHEGQVVGRIETTRTDSGELRTRTICPDGTCRDGQDPEFLVRRAGEAGGPGSRREGGQP